MAYIGNQPFTTAFLTDQFSGTGSQTAFTLSAAPANTNSLLVAVTGVLQDPSTYSVAGTTLTFSAAPPSGTGNISVRFLGIPASGVVTTAYRTLTEFTATAGQTTFTPPSYTVGYINVFRNGVMLGTADYTASNGTTVVLASAASAGDLVVTESFYVSSVLNAIPGTAGSVGTTYLVDGSVTPAKLSTGGPSWDTSSNLTVNGLLNISAATAGQIQFPATQNPSSNANTLDDYEEGTWTPTVNLLGTITYAARNATYVKIGKRVYLTVYMRFSSTNTTQDSTNISFDGLPFASTNVTGTFYEAGAAAILSERLYGSSGTAATQFFIGVNPGTTSLRMFQGNYNGTVSNASWFANANRDSYRGSDAYMLFQFFYDTTA